MISIANWDARSGRPESVKARSSARNLLRSAWGSAGRPWSTSRLAVSMLRCTCFGRSLSSWDLIDFTDSRRDELLATSDTVEFEKAMVKQIDNFAKGDSARTKLLTRFANKL